MRSRTRCDTYHRFSRVANDDEVAKQRVPERRMGQDVDIHVSKTVESTPRLLRPCFRPAESTVIFSEHMICNVDIRVNLYANVVSPSDTAFSKGTGERSFKELTALAPFLNEVHVVAPPERKHSVWIGVQRLASGVHDTLSSYS